MLKLKLFQFTTFWLANRKFQGFFKIYLIKKLSKLNWSHLSQSIRVWVNNNSLNNNWLIPSKILGANSNWKDEQSVRDLVYLVRSQIHTAVDVYQLKGHGKVLVAVCCKGGLGFGREVHPVTQVSTQSVLSGLDTALSLGQRDSFMFSLTWWSWCRCSGLCPLLRDPCWRLQPR